MNNHKELKLFTSESVTEGHPDKIADQISDGVLDAILAQDPKGRVACETFLVNGLCLIGGEITTSCYVDIPKIARSIIKDIGYTDAEYGFQWETSGVAVAVKEQSGDIARGVDSYTKKESGAIVNEDLAHLGAGDQGLMFGYATKETPELMPLPITLAHRLCRRLAEVRKKSVIKGLRPDGKSQVTIEYKGDQPYRIHTLLMAVQHNASVPQKRLRREIVEKVMKPVLFDRSLRVKGGYDWQRETRRRWNEVKVYVNSTGRFVIGGPQGDAGLTGRKIIVDTYGGMGRHGGGAFCIDGASFVNTEKGLLRIQSMERDIKHGLAVKTDIHPHRAGDWYDNGSSKTIEITTKNGYALRGTPNHRIRVLEREGNYVWRRLDSLRKDDFIAIQKKDRLFGRGPDVSDFSYTYKEGTAEGRKNKFIFPEILTEDYAYLLGLLVGDGNCMMKGGIAICVCEKEQERNIQKLYQRLFGKKGKIFGHWAFMGGVELRAYLDHLGLARKRSWEKNVPWSIFRSSKECTAAFVRGLFDTDGGVRIHGRYNNFPDIKLASTSHALIKEVQQLLLNFGIVTMTQRVNVTGKFSFIRGRRVTSKRPLYNLRIKNVEGVAIFKSEIGFGLPRKQRILRSVSLDGKRNYFVLPHQRARVQRLWSFLTSREHQKDIGIIGRFTRSIAGKATKMLTYEKLKEFLRLYKDRLGGEKDFQYLQFLYGLEHFYDTVIAKKSYKAVHTYDLYVPEAQTFIANGFVCHNSGKDPTKVDRSGSYAARWVAKNIVAAGLAKRVETQIAYAIGIPEPLSVRVDTFGTGRVSDTLIVEAVRKVFDLRPGMIIKELNLRRPLYKQVAAYGHFGRPELKLPWEETKKAKELKAYVKKALQ